MHERLIELKEWWRDFNTVDSYGMDGPSAILGLGLFVVLTPIACIFDRKLRQELGKDVLRMAGERFSHTRLGQRVQDIRSRRFDSRMSRASGVEDSADLLDKPEDQ